MAVGNKKTQKKGGSTIKVPSNLGIGNRKAEVKFVEADNPNYSKVHAGAPGNPKTVTVAYNLRESPIAMMAAKGHITTHQLQAANEFRRLWESLGGSGAPALDYSLEKVDGGQSKDPISLRQMQAGKALKECRMVLGRRHFDIVEKVAGEGCTIAQLGASKRERFTLADYLRDALDDLAVHWGYQKRKSPENSSPLVLSRKPLSGM
jgi:hypothetical protein